MSSASKILQCPICRKFMRSDSLRRHWRVKHNDFKVNNTVRRGTDKDVSNTPSINEWRSEIVSNGTMLDEGKKLTISRQEEEEEDEEIKLFPWQTVLLGFVYNSTCREIVWVRGAHGNEGKTWFQNYVQSMLGTKRVAHLNLKNSSDNIMHILRELPLSSIDTFLFNDTRAGPNEMRCYEILENIKDGRAFASKWSSELIRFQTPNVVIVFSNDDPDMTQLSKDRWRVLYINKEGLSMQEIRLWELQKSIKVSRMQLCN